MADEDTLKYSSLGLFARRNCGVTTPAPGPYRTLFCIRGELNGEKEELHFFEGRKRYEVGRPRRAAANPARTILSTKSVLAAPL
jgi:hypothetical protein